MAIFDLYSKSLKKYPDQFVYDKIPEKLKNQVYHIWQDFFDEKNISNSLSNEAWDFILKTLLKELGQKSLYSNPFFGRISSQAEVEGYLTALTENEVEKILDVIHISFFTIELTEKINRDRNFFGIKLSAGKVIKELNDRFKENGVGYQYSNSKIIKLDNELLHKEILEPTLNFLNERDYANVNDEFLSALGHYRHKRNKECLIDCLKAFETTMKIICNKNKWNYKENDTAKPLINTLLTNHFLPLYHQNQLANLKQLLESGIPTIRNKNSGHGQGNKKIIVNDHVASYMINITGSTIKLFVETQKLREK